MGQPLALGRMDNPGKMETSSVPVAAHSSKKRTHPQGRTAAHVGRNTLT